MQVKKFNISKPKKYTKGGVEKTQWNNIGVITEFHKDDGSVSRIIEIPAIGLEANIFPFKEREEIPPRVKVEEGEARPEDIPEEDINPADIPF